MPVQVRVNQSARLVEAAAQTPLLYVLRNDFGLNGPKFGCGLGQCGACNVLVGGRLTRSCVFPLSAVGTDQVVTLEGLGTAAQPHPLQRAFLAEQAAQCGYCTSGMILAAKALLDQHADPDEATIRQGLAGQICRCGIHNRIVRAVRRAAAEMKA